MINNLHFMVFKMLIFGLCYGFSYLWRLTGAAEAPQKWGGGHLPKGALEFCLLLYIVKSPNQS